MHLIEIRAKRFYTQENSAAIGSIYQGDSQSSAIFSQIKNHQQVSWVITSPPYYGMRTYIPDQWLRAWFLGGKSDVDYSAEGQISHNSPQSFAAGLRQVWQNAAQVSTKNAQLIIRFGGINDRKVDPLSIIEHFLQNSSWKIK